MQSVVSDNIFGDLGAECPFCGHYCVLGKGRGDACVHLEGGGPDGRYLLFSNGR